MLPSRLLLIPGSLRSKSTTTAVLRTIEVFPPRGAAATFYEGLATLPPFNPDDDTDDPPEPAAALRQAIHGADALLFSVPEYAGGLPGSFKNLLDWTIGDDQPGSIYEKPVAWINASPRGAFDAHDSLRKVLSYAHALIVEPACADIPVTTSMIGDDGVIFDVVVRERISRAVALLAASMASTA